MQHSRLRRIANPQGNRSSLFWRRIANPPERLAGLRFFFTSGVGNRVRAHRGSRGCRRLATGETFTTNNLVLDDGKDFVAYETFAAKVASYSRTMKEGTTWATLCLPFAIDLSQVKECKFYRLDYVSRRHWRWKTWKGRRLLLGWVTVIITPNGIIQ